ncbi:MAG: DUF4968 domain-containing protein, partial [Muribaculaceae bacterium]|nr:DUF4968 domain-containing protein [Muribaculaceae bacterium]
MKLRTLSFMLLGLAGSVLAGSCSGAYTKDGQSVTVKVDPEKAGGASKIRLQVIGPKIIRVSATPTGDFADGQSLITVPQEKYTDFTVKQETD